MFDRTETTEHEDGAEAYRSLTMNDVIGEVRTGGLQSMLFGEYWLEGEMALLAGDVGRGKSTLAMQIAESIASGKSIEPLEVTAGKRPVIYIDLEMSARQIAVRYAGDERRRGKLTNVYKFSNRLHRVELAADRLVNAGSPEQTAQVLGRCIEAEVQKHDARIVIVDSLTALKRSYYGSNELLPVIRTLKRLAAEHGLSILVLADVASSERTKSLTMNMLGGLRLVANAVDSVFALGQSGNNTSARYVKRLRARSLEIVYNELHAPEFLLKKTGGNFLGFEFVRFGSEREFLVDKRHESEHQAVENMRRMQKMNRSIRDIAASFGKSKSSVHRLLKMAPEPSVEPVAAQAESSPKPYDPRSSPFYFPGREEYVAAGEHPKFDGIDYTDRTDDAILLLKREAYLIQAASARARKIYLATGKAPRLSEDPKLIEFWAENNLKPITDTS